MSVQQVLVHLWAGARAAAGTGEVCVSLGPSPTVAQVRDAVVEALPDRPELPRVLEVCSALVGDRPVGASAAPDVQVPPDTSVEFLPPFAGG